MVFSYQGEDGGHYEGQFEYFNSDDQLVKTMSYNAGEHGSSWTTEYFSDGKKICSIDEGVSWTPYFNLNTTVTYYERGRHEIRRDFYDSRGVEVSRVKNEESLFKYDLKNIIPQ